MFVSMKHWCGFLVFKKGGEGKVVFFFET
jgi:hypothetical protein